MAYTLVPTELIVDGAVTSAKLDTNISISGTLGVTGELTLATHMNMGDNDKIKIGTGGDLEIYHDGSNSYISNSTGNIYLADTNGSVHIQAKLNEESIVCTADGAVSLYHDNAVKLATSSAGVTVTGTVVADGLTVDTSTLVVDSTNNRVGIGTSSPASLLSVQGDGTIFRLDGTANTTRTIFFRNTTSSNPAQIHSDGSLKLRAEDSGTHIEFHTADSERMRINSGGDLLLGTTSGTAVKLNVQSSKANGLAAELANTQSSTGSGIVVKGGNNSSTYSADFRDYNNTNLMRLTGEGKLGLGTTSPSTPVHIVNTSSPQLRVAYNGSNYQDLNYEGSNIVGGSHVFKIAGSEKMRLDTSGNFGIGDTSPIAKLTVKAASDTIRAESLATDAKNITMSYEDSNDFGAIRCGQDGVADKNLLLRGASLLFQRNGGTEAMRIDSSGNVGIGTSSPSTGLHVVTGGGTTPFRVQGGANSGVNIMEVGYAGGGAGANFIVDDNGNVGIGTTSPTEKLTVNGALAITGALADDRTSTAAMDFSSGVSRIVSYGASGTAGITAFRTASGGASSSELMRILGTGEVHITSGGDAITPTTKHSGATGDIAKLRLINRSGQSSNKGGLLELGAVTNDGVDRSDVFVSIAGLKQNATSGDMKGYLQIAMNNGSALDEVIRVTPTGTMHVNRDIGAHSNVTSYAHSTYDHAAVFGRNSTPDGTVVIEDYDVSSGIGNTVLKLFLRDQDPATSATFVAFADGGGRVGSVTHNDDGGGVSFNTTSDYRLKENVNYTWDALPLLTQLKPAKFNFISNPTKTVQGMLAHEVMDIVPSSVKGDKDHIEPTGTVTDSEGNTVMENVYEHFCKEGQTWTRTGEEPIYQELDYSRLVPLLTKAIQEQQTIIDDLKSRIETLEG